MKAGDFCSNWTGDGQVHPLDPGANVLHTEGLHTNKKRMKISNDHTKNLLSSKYDWERSYEKLLLFVSFIITVCVAA